MEFLFKRGDLVELNSGGPAMTVVECDERGNVLCRWFPGGKYGNQHETMAYEFPQVCLKPVVKQDPTVLSISPKVEKEL